MALKLYVSKTEASFFLSNTLYCDINIPTEGEHKVGDLVISNIQQDDVIGWICIEKGNPGKWKELRNAGDWIDIQLNQMHDNISEIMILNKETNDRIVMIGQQVNAFDDKINNTIVDIENDMTIFRESLENVITQVDTNKKEFDLYVDLADLVINSLTKQITANTGNINKLDKSVADIISSNETSMDDIEKQINNIREILGQNAEDGEQQTSGILKEIEEIRKLLGQTAEEGEQQASGLLKEIEEIRELLGQTAEEGEQQASGLLKEIEEIRELLGQNAEEGEQQASGILKDIQELDTRVTENEQDILDIQNILGNVSGNSSSSSLVQQVIDNRTNLANLTARVTADETLTNNNKTNITNLTARVTANETQINTNKTDIASLKTKVTANETQINTNKTSISNLSNQITALNEKTSGTDSSADINSKDVQSSGTLSTDNYASYGKAYTATAGSSNVNLYSATMTEVKYGRYGICLRMKISSNSSSSNVVKLTVYNGSTVISTTNFTGNAFSMTSDYSLLYSTFDYTGNGNVKQNLKIQVDVLANSGVTVSFDYAYINMVIPSVFL